MSLLHSHIDEAEFIQSDSGLLIHEISKPLRPFDSGKPNQKIPLKYKNPEVSYIK